MKKIFSLALVFLLIFGLSACKNQNDNSTKDDLNSGNQSYVDSSQSTVLIDSVHTHSYSDGIVTKQPTCKEQGIKTYYCNGCSGTKMEAVPAIGHNWQNATCTSPKKCSQCGDTTGDKLEHAYSNNNCTLCGSEKITFNYSRQKYPVEIKMSGVNTPTVCKVTALKCVAKEGKVYACVDSTAVKGVTRPSILKLKFNIVSAVGQNVATHTVSYFFEDLELGESFSKEEAILSWQNFLKLEPGDYYVTISGVWYI